MIGAILRAHFLGMRLRRGSRRAGAIFGVVTALMFYGFWAFLASMLMLLFSGLESRENALAVLSGMMALMTLYWQMGPIVTASFGASLDMRKLLAYPIPHNKLFVIELMLRATSCAEMLILLAGITTGLMRNPLWPKSPAPLAGALLFAALNILVAAGTRSWLERVVLRSRLREVFSLLMILLAVAPQMLRFMDLKGTAFLRLAPTQFAWPWGSMAGMMLHNASAASAGVSVVWVAAAFWFGHRQFEANLRVDESAVRRATPSEARERFTDRIFRLPSRFLPDPLGAIVEKELHTLVRIPRFRIVYLMSCLFGLLLFAPALRKSSGDSWLMHNAPPLMALYGLLMLGQITYWNALGFDRSAAQGYFCWPIRFRDVLIGKNISVLIMLIPQVLAVSAVGRIAHMPVTAGKTLEAMLVVIIASMYWFAIGNISSVRIPRAMNPDKMNQMTNKMQALTIWVQPFLLLPIGIAYWARYILENELVFACLLAVAAIIGGVVYYIALDTAVKTAMDRREAIVQELSRSDGPVSIA